MSWSTSTSGTPIAKSEIPNIAAPYFYENPPGASDSMKEQFEKALEVAAVLAEATGRPDDLVSVTLSGHGNPEHAPASGWADEMISVSVSAVAKPA